MDQKNIGSAQRLQRFVVQDRAAIVLADSGTLIALDVAIDAFSDGDLYPVSTGGGAMGQFAVAAASVGISGAAHWVSPSLL